KDKLTVIIYDDDLPNIKSFSETVLSDRQAADYVGGIALHWYFNHKGNRNDLDYLYHKFHNHFILATEACLEYHEKSHHIILGNWDGFYRYADDIIKDLNHYSTGWMDWNMAIDLKGGPSWVGNKVNAPIIVNATGHEYYKQPMFYAMGHFSKFLVPDSVRLQHNLHTNDAKN